MRFAVIQLNSRDDRQANIVAAVRGIREAADRGAALVALPEMTVFCGPLDQVAKHAETIPGPTVEALADAAWTCRVFVLIGSVHERAADGGLPYNTSVLIDRTGQIVATYRKLHLFDAPGLEMESPFLQPGTHVAVAETPLGHLGLSICYDLRFPELYRELSARGAEVLFVPSAFTMQTGRDHWEVLLRARAIENLAYVVAPNQWGPHPPDKQCYGHSMIVGPWGTVLCRVPDGPGIAYADVDLRKVTQARQRLHALQHRRATATGFQNF